MTHNLPIGLEYSYNKYNLLRSLECVQKVYILSETTIRLSKNLGHNLTNTEELKSQAEEMQKKKERCDLLE